MPKAGAAHLRKRCCILRILRRWVRGEETEGEAWRRKGEPHHHLHHNWETTAAVDGGAGLLALEPHHMFLNPIEQMYRKDDSGGFRAKSKMRVHDCPWVLFGSSSLRHVQDGTGITPYM